MNTLCARASRPRQQAACEEASERLHALHEGDETQSAAGRPGERERRHQPHPGPQGEKPDDVRVTQHKHSFKGFLWLLADVALFTIFNV